MSFGKSIGNLLGRIMKITTFNEGRIEYIKAGNIMKDKQIKMKLGDFDYNDEQELYAGRICVGVVGKEVRYGTTLFYAKIKLGYRNYSLSSVISQEDVIEKCRLKVEEHISDFYKELDGTN